MITHGYGIFVQQSNLRLEFQERATEEYARAVMSAMISAGVPDIALRIYRQTLTLEEL